MPKEFVKIVQSDRRGQIVIPKKIRAELDIKEGAAFWIYRADDVICLKKIQAPNLKSKK